MMNNRFALCSVLALTLPLAGCDQKAPHTPPPDQYATQAVVQNPVIGADEIYSLVSPVALFPDSLLAQVLAASTSPSDVTAAHSWLREHSTLKGEKLALQAEMQSWSPAVKALTAFPDVLTQMANNPQWTRELGVAYTRQPQDVMNAVQILRARAQQNGALKSTPQQRVRSTPASVTTSVANAVPVPTQTITIRPAQSGVVYVPVYPQTVYGNPPVIYYPGYMPSSYSSADMAATGLISFTAGVMLGTAMNNSWGVHWGGSPVVVYNNHTFVNHTVISDRHFAGNRPVFAPGPVRTPHFAPVHNAFAPAHMTTFTSTHTRTPTFAPRHQGEHLSLPHNHHVQPNTHHFAMAPGPVRLLGEQSRRQEMLTSFNPGARFAGGFAFRRRG